MLKAANDEPRNPSALESLGCVSFLIMLGVFGMILLDALSKRGAP